MASFKLSLLTLMVIAILIPDSESGSKNKDKNKNKDRAMTRAKGRALSKHTLWRINFRLGVQDIPDFDDSKDEADFSDVYLRVWRNGVKQGETDTYFSVITKDFDETFQVIHHGDLTQQLVIEAFDDDTRNDKQPNDYHIGNAHIKLHEISRVGSHVVPIFSGTRQEGKVVVHTYGVIVDGTDCDTL